METGIKVVDAMTTQPIAVSPDTNLKECARLMARRGVGSLVVKEDNHFIGIITEQDIVRKAVAQNVIPAKKSAKDVMEDKIITIGPGKDIFEAIRLMRDYNIRHLPVVDDGKVLGLVTMKDVLKIEPDLFDLLVEKLDIREEARKPVYSAREKEGICESCGEYSEDIEYSEGSHACEKCREE